MKKKLLLLLLATSLTATSLAGCSLFGEGEPEVTDTTIRISVTKDMLMQSEEEVVEEKTADELYTIGEVFTYDDLTFVELIPGKTLAANGAKKALCKFKDTAYVTALLNAKDSIYIDADIEPISSAKTNVVFQKVSGTLSSMSYDDMFNKIYADLAKFGETPVSEQTAPVEEVTEEQTEETTDDNEETSEETADETENTETAEETAESTEDTEVTETTTETTAEEETTETTSITLDMESELNQAFSQYSQMQSEGKVYLSPTQLEDIARDYFTKMNFSQATDPIIYDANCVGLGQYTSGQLNAYVNKINGVPTDYTLVSGYAKLSDLLDGVVYKTNALDNQNGAFTIHIKNDTNKPVNLTVWAADIDQITPPENATKVPFLTDSFKVSGYYPENEWSNTDTNTTYYFTFDYLETDKALADLYEAESTTLKLSQVSPDEKGKYTFDSKYNIVINDLPKDVVITSNSKEEEVLKPDTAIAIHPEMYVSFRFEQIEPEPEGE